MSERTKVFGIIIVFFVIGFVVYGNVIDGKFLWDDDNNIVNNTYIKDFAHFGDFFSKDLLAGSGQSIGWYRPVLLLSYSLDRHLWGLNPTGYHVVNILLHIFSAVVLFFITLKIFKKKLTAFLSGLLFLTHPVQTEAVSYISGRADLLMTLFVLLSFYFFLLFQNQKHTKNRAVLYGAALVSFSVALLSKETAVIFPLLLGLFLLTLAKKEEKLSLKKVSMIVGPFFGASALYQILRMTLLNFNHSFSTFGINLGHRVLVFLKVLPIYWKSLFIPLGLHYHFERKLAIGVPDTTIIISILILTLLIFITAYFKRLRKFFVFGFGWFFIGLIPVSGILVPINFIVGERWLYFSAVGLFILTAVLFEKVYNSISSKQYRGVSVILMVTYFLFLGVIGIKRNSVWENGVLLIKDTLKYEPNDPKLHNSLGLEYIKEKQDNEALQEFKLASSLDPSDPTAYNNLGIFYVTHKMNNEAIYEFEKMISLNQNLKFGYGILADLNYQNKEYAKTVDWLVKLSVISPDSWEVYYKLGIVYNLMGDKGNSSQALNEAIRLNPQLLEKLRK